MEDYGKHYLALGLRPGATQKEIHSAFRRMAKMYHPDQDTSLDGQMRYLEARRAYDVLRKKADTQPPNPDTATNRTTTCGAGWYAHAEYEYEHDGGFDFSDLMEQYGARKKAKKRPPFSFEKAPEILRESVEEIACVGMFIRVLLHVVAMRFLFSGMGYGWIISSVVIFCSLIGFAFFRYYFSSDPASDLLANCVGSLLYAAVLSFLLHSFNSSLLLRSWYAASIAILCALFLLWERLSAWIVRAIISSSDQHR